MNDNSNLLCLFLICIWGLTACNPECDEIHILSATPPVAVGGSQILIQSTNPDILEGGQVTVNNLSVDVVEFRAAQPMAGLIVQLPEFATSEAVNMTYVDPDCGEIPISNGIDIRTAADAFNTVGFVAPAPPNIIIPLTTPPPPPVIQNAWFSPDNSDYCIWFRFFKDANGNSTTVLEPATDKGDFGQMKGSAELAVSAIFGCPDAPDSYLYHDNPVFGVIVPPNPEENDFGYINFTIDRTQAEVNGVVKDLGREEFEGQFVKIEETNYTIGGGLGCGPTIPEEPYLMIVYSKLTGRPLVLFRGPE